MGLPPDPPEPYRARLEALGRLKLNLDLERRSEYTAKAGWNIDQHEAELPPEPPGEPIEHGSFRAAQQIVREYRFPPPELITGIFLPDQPLETRVMLLRARFFIFTFYFGVRVGAVTDTVQDTPQGQERVWGYNYATLEGHFERGQIEFSVHKRLTTGEVAFHIRSFSRTGTITNPFYRIGFVIFGRALQRRFARESLKRMQALVREALEHGQASSEGPSVRPASEESLRARLEAADHSGGLDPPATPEKPCPRAPSRSRRDPCRAIFLETPNRFRRFTTRAQVRISPRRYNRKKEDHMPDPVKDAIKDAEEGVKDIARDASPDFEALRADFEALKTDMAELVKSLKSEAKSKVKDVREDLEEGGERLSEQLRKLLEKGSDATQAAAQSATHSLEHQVSERPLMSMIGAFGIGLLVARLMDRR